MEEQIAVIFVPRPWPEGSWRRVWGHRAFVGGFVAEPARLPWGNRSLLLRDPDGNLVSFFTPHPGRHRKVRSVTTSQPPAGASGH